MSDEMNFPCPECETERIFPTLAGWKRHMTSMHNGYTADQVEEVQSSKDEGLAVAGGENLLTAVSRMPTSEDALDKDRDETPKLSAAEKKDLKERNKRIRARFDTLRKRISTDVPEDAFRYAGIELEEKDKELLGEAIDLSLEVVGVDFEVSPIAFTVRNPFIILLYPLFVIAIIVVKTFIQRASENKEDEK